MQKPKELFKEIVIAAGAGGSRQSPGSTEAKVAKEKSIIIHPPIESHWHLPPLKNYKGSVGSRDKFKRMLAYPFKLRSLKLRKSNSMKMILEGVRNPKDQELVNSFREMLLRDGLSPGKHYDYHTLLRFLRMRDFNVTKAKEMFLNYLKWREEFGVDVIAKGSSNFSKPARHIFMEIQKIDSNYYPETLNRLFIINAGSAFKVLWTAIKAFLEPRTIAKIKVLGTNYLSNLVEAIDPSNLPAFLGGSCTCSDSGGCLFSDKGPWNNPETVEMLEALLASEDECEDRDDTGPTAKEADISDTDNVQVKDVYDVSTTAEDASGLISEETSFLNQPPMWKMEAFEALLIEAKMKIEKLESALEDTKLVLRGLAEHMEELKRN